MQRLSQVEGVNLAGIKRIIELEQLVDELQARLDEMAEELAAARAAAEQAAAACTPPTAATSCPSTGARRWSSGGPNARSRPVRQE